MRTLLLAKRKKAGLTQKALGDQLGVTGQTISEWERGTRDPQLQPKQIELYCQILDVDLSELVQLFEEK